ncbi:MAG: DUF58 domain-containing protein [Lachnospiraceae bacterium]|nr:DUF58 domain-containing protein [Lachnospiraceae bacterium]
MRRDADKNQKRKKAKKPDIIGGLKARRRGDYVRYFDGIFSSAVFILIFALFCSARVGFFLLISLVLAPAVSVLMAFLSSKFVTVSVRNEGGNLSSEKGDKVALCLDAYNKMIIPSCLVRITLKDSAGTEAEEKEINISVRGRGTVSVPLLFYARMAGGVRIGIDEICCEDFFRVARFPVKVDGTSSYKCGVNPMIPEISSKDPVLEETMRTALIDDKSDDTIELPTYNFSGFPGYDYREYEPGDPLKRINYKLSAKVGELMVRLDERPITSGVVIFLDSDKPENADENPVIPGAVENMLETAMGMIRTLISRDFGVTVYWKDEEGKENEISVRTEKELSDLRSMLGFFILSEQDERLPDIVTENGSGLICFTCKADAALISGLEQNSKDAGSICIFNAITGEGRTL